MQSATLAVTGNAVCRPKWDKGGTRGYAPQSAHRIGGLHPPYGS